jgi:ribosomal protein L34
MIFITLAALLVALPMKETYKPIILKQRAKKHGMTPLATPHSSQKVTKVLATRIMRPFHMLYTEVGI